MNDQNRTIIAGRKPVLEALKAGTPLKRIVVLAGQKGAVLEEIMRWAGRRKVGVQTAGRDEFARLAGDAMSQGIVAVAEQRRYSSLDDLLDVPLRRHEAGFILVLDEIEDPHNLGALIRTAECTGVHGVILPRHHAAPVTSTVVKSSAGATEYIPVAEVTNIARTLQLLKEHRYWVVGLDAGGNKQFTDIDASTPLALVVGNEGRGIRRLVKEQCDYLVRIPLFGQIQSLNASVAGALAMYEVARKRHGKG